LASLPLVGLWDKRHLIFHFAILNIQMRFKTTYLGVLWAAVEPLLTFIVLYVVFTSIRAQQSDYAIYLITGIVFYHIFVRGTSGGLGSLTSNSGIITAFNTKREFFPVVATGQLDFWP
jgi:ABC-type polysaccharide/polyol phosphate export permease